ncbi:MAG TPA: hypothetical protein VHS09_02030, partial [Polyangiaceae bacterium]|nr:hypothetical protein [Polyangiaceae bacterium]
RSLFLTLTGAIAGSTACYVDRPPPPPPPRPVVYQYAAPPRPGPPTTRYYYVNRGGQRIATRVVVRKRPAPPVGGVTADPTYRPPPPNLGVVGPSTEGLAPATTSEPVVPPPAPPGDAPGCLDTSSVAVPDCNRLKIDPSCGIRSFVVSRCNTYRDYFDSTVATVAVSCMEAMSSKQLCDAENTYSCGKQALTEACPDTELAQLCSIAASSCKTTAADCTALLSGLNDAAKQAVAKCIATGCHSGLYSCVEGLSSH